MNESLSHEGYQGASVEGAIRRLGMGGWWSDGSDDDFANAWKKAANEANHALLMADDATGQAHIITMVDVVGTCRRRPAGPSPAIDGRSDGALA